MLGLLAEGQEGHVDFCTTCEEMDLNVCGSSEDTRHKTIPKTKNLMSAGHLTGREGGAETRSRRSAELGSRPGSVPHHLWRSLCFSGSQFSHLQSGTNSACPGCLVRGVCVCV